jgi:hypothetical protein
MIDTRKLVDKISPMPLLNSSSKVKWILYRANVLYNEFSAINLEVN